MSNIQSVTNGNLLQIMFSNGVKNQLSRDSRDWDMIKMMKKGPAAGRELRYMVQTGMGPGAIQYRNSTTTTFPAAQKVSTQELTAEYKEIAMTIEIDYNLWKRLENSKDVRYFNILELELQSKMDAAKRRFSADLYNDGLGVMGTAASVVDTTGANGYATVTLSSSDSARGHIGFFEKGDLLHNYNAAGTIDSPTVVGTFYAWIITNKNRKLNTVTLQAIDSSFNVLSLTGSSIDAGDVFYRIGQTTIPDLTGAISDYGFATENMLGLESLSANDGRTVNGLVQSGFTGGSRFDVGGVQLDVTHLQAALDDAKINVGEGAYSYKRMIMSPEAHAIFIDSRESDRRFQSVQDNKRGTTYFAFQHRNDLVETYVSEYCPKKRIYIVPEVKSNADKVIEFYGADFEPVSLAGSNPFMLKPASAGGVERKVQHFLETQVQLIVNRPAAICAVHNFTLA